MDHRTWSGGGEGQTVASSDEPGHAKNPGSRKNEKRKQKDGRTLDKQGAIEINREYCEEYAQNTKLSLFLTLFSFTPALCSAPPPTLFSRCPPRRFAFVCTNVCSVFLTFVARLASTFSSVLHSPLSFALTRSNAPRAPPELNLCPEMFR